MKIRNILVAGAAIFMATACTDDEEVFVVGNEAKAMLNFTAVNLSVNNTATNWETDYNGLPTLPWAESKPQGYESTNGLCNFDLPFYYEYWSGQWNWSGDHNVRMWPNGLWTGFNNELEFEFIPDCIENKEAVFTMPDGQTFRVTASNPRFTWTTPLPGDNDEWQNVPVEAESTYEKGGVVFKAKGYISLSLDNYICFDGGKWTYADHWLNVNEYGNK